MPNPLPGILDWWGAWLVRRRKWVLWLALLLALGALPVAVGVVRRLDVDILNQVSDRLPRFRAFREISTDFGGDLFAAVLWIPDDAARDPACVAELQAFGEILTGELSRVGVVSEDAVAQDGPLAGISGRAWLRQVECRFGQHLKEALLQLTLDSPHVLLRADEVRRLEALFGGPALEQRMKEVRTEYEGYGPASLERRRLLADPLGLAKLGEEALERRLKDARVGLKLVGDQDYFLSPDHTTMVILARPARSAQNLEFNRALASAVWRAENRALEAFQARRSAPRLTTARKPDSFNAYPAGAQPDLRVGYTGMHAVSVENEASLRADIVLNTLTAGLFVLAIYLVVYWRVRLAVHVILVLGLAVLCTLALALPLHGPVGVLGVGFTSILIGMGEDYAVYLHNTFQGFRGQGSGDEPALRRTLAHCGPSILAAALTAAVAFFGLSLAHFRAVAELGFLAGLGLTLSALFMLSVFPALMLGAPGQRGGAEVVRPVAAAIGGLGRLQATAWGRALCLLAGLCVGAAAVGLIAWGPDPGADSLLGVRFDGELGNLRSLRIQAVPLRQRVAERFGQGLQDIKVIVESGDEASAFGAVEQIDARLLPLLRQGELTSSGNVATWVEPPAVQDEHLAALRALDLDACAQRFLAAARGQFGARGQTAFQPFTQRLHELAAKVRSARPLTLQELKAGPLAGLLELYARVDGQGPDRRVRLVLGYMPGDPGYPGAWFERLAGLVEQQPPAGVTVRLTGPRMLGLELRAYIFRDMAWITALVGAAVAIVILVMYRSPLRALLALLPVTFGYRGVLGGVQAAQALGWDFSLNYVNLIIFPLLLGTGIDYGIYLVSDAFSERRPGVAQLVSETGLSVFVACLTTLAGFGSMVVSNYTGLVSFGWTSVLGYAGTLFGALVVLPALLARRNHEAGAGDRASCRAGS